MSINVPLNEPFTEGSSSSDEVPWPFPVALGGHGYVIDLKDYQRETLDLARQGSDDSQEQNDKTLTNLGPWRRSQISWHKGAGQEFLDGTTFADLRADRSRFRESKGVDCWTPGHITLLNDTEEKRSSAAVNLKLLDLDDTLYLVSSTIVQFVTSATATTWTVTNSNIHGASTAVEVEDITTDGANVYAAAGVNGIRKTVKQATTSSLFSTFVAHVVEFGNGRLLAADNTTAELFEVSAAGAKTSIKTHFTTSFDWTTIAASPNGWYCGGYAGTHGEVYFVSVDPNTGALTKPIEACQLARGEIPYALYAYGEVVLLGTNLGFRAGRIRDDGSLILGRQVEVAGGVRDFAGDGPFVWFTWTNYDATSTGLGRINLAELTDPENFVFAYASDVMATAQGTVLSVVSFGGRRYFTVSGDGFKGQNGDLVASGTIRCGKLRFETLEPKVLIGADLRHEPLDGSVAFAVTEEDGVTTTFGTSATAGSLGPDGLFDGQKKVDESFEPVLTLTRESASAGPDVRRYTLRAFPRPFRTEIVRIPILLSELVAVGGENQDEEYDTLAEFLFLKGLEADRVPVLYQEGTQSYSVIVDKVKPVPESWNADRSFFQGKVLVDLMTVEEVG